ncbi:MAG TPA: cytochrome c oxidase subunit 3 [Terriglobia bacterium]|nr:cytochrome c oxidase subunit 3 [Terriglobia bacterium]
MGTESIQSVEQIAAYDHNKLAMILFIISEGTFFVFLIIAYVYFHSVTKTGPTAANSLDLVKTSIFTVLLLASSFTMWRAEKSLRQGRPNGFRNWLIVTIVLGAAFLYDQGKGYFHLYHDNVTMSRNIFGTTFFTLTGFHGFHVLLGLIALCVLLGLTLAGDFKTSHSSAVETVTLYWHFVDWVWVVIFSVIYLWAFL